MDKIQKYPKTIGDYVKVKDYSKENSTIASDQANASANTTELNEALKNAVERVDSVGTMTVSDSSLKQAIKIVGTDGKEYLVKAMLWDKPAMPSIKADFVPKEGTRKTSVTSGACVSTEDAFKVTITHTNGGGKIYYTTGTTIENTPTPTTSSTQYSSEITFHPNLATERQDIVIKAIVNYTGQNSDVRTITLSFYRKIKLTLSYSPSNVPDTTQPAMGGHSPMYFSAYGTVTASTNGANSPTWTNSKGGNTNSMTFYEDTPDTYWFKATESGWLDSDETHGAALEIRHLRLIGIEESAPNINIGNNGIYEPYKRFTVNESGETYDTNNVKVIPTVHYTVTYSNPSRTDDTGTIGWGAFRNVSGNCVVSAWTTATGESGYPDWQGQSAAKTIECRNLPMPTLKTELSDNNGAWASGLRVTVSGITINDENNNPIQGYKYSDNNGSTYQDYTEPKVVTKYSETGGTIAANSIKAKREVDTWTTSSVASAPSSAVTVSRPYVYVGVYKKADVGNVNEVNFDNLTNADIISLLTDDAKYARKITKSEAAADSGTANTPKLKWEDNVSAPFVAFPATWGSLELYTIGNVPYSLSSVTQKSNLFGNGISYKIYYKNQFGGSLSSENNPTIKIG